MLTESGTYLLTVVGKEICVLFSQCPCANAISALGPWSCSPSIQYFGFVASCCAWGLSLWLRVFVTPDSSFDIPNLCIMQNWLSISVWDFSSLKPSLLGYVSAYGPLLGLHPQHAEKKTTPHVFFCSAHRSNDLKRGPSTFLLRHPQRTYQTKILPVLFRPAKS